MPSSSVPHCPIVHCESTTSPDRGCDALARDLLLQILRHLQVALQGRELLLGPFLDFGVLAFIGLSMEQVDGLLMILDHLVKKRAIEGRALEARQVRVRLTGL